MIKGTCHFLYVCIQLIVKLQSGYKAETLNQNFNSSSLGAGGKHLISVPTCSILGGFLSSQCITQMLLAYCISLYNL